ncbi:MAG: hypothetical protein AAF235_04685 [Planctomycetota bacterium]
MQTGPASGKNSIATVIANPAYEGPAEPNAAAGGRRIRAGLRRVRRAARVLLLIRASGRIISGLVAATVAAGVLDFAVRTPAALRWCLLIGGIVAVCIAIRRLIVPAARFRPSLADVALRIERGIGRETAAVVGAVASAAEFERDRTTRGNGWVDQQGENQADDRQRTSGSVSFADRAVDHGRRIFERAHENGVLRFGPALVWSGTVAAAALFLAVLAVAAPASTGIAATRLMAPWSDAAWPRRTDVRVLIAAGPHPADTPLALRAAVVRSPADEPTVWARYRVVTETGTGVLSGEWRRIALADQRRSVEAGTSGESGGLFEALLTADALRPIAASGDETDVTPSSATFVEYEVSSGDDATELARVRVVEPPRLIAVSAAVVPPAYARGVAAATGFRGIDGESVGGNARIDMGDGTDTRAVVGPVLQGSSVDIELRFSSPVLFRPEVTRTGRANAGRSGDASPVLTGGGGFELRDTLNLRGDLDASIRLGIRATNEFGLALRNEPSIAFDVVPDARASVSILRPARNEAVLATAVVPVAAEARDDLGLASLAVTRAIASAPADSMAVADSTEEHTTAVPSAIAIIASWSPAVGSTPRATAASDLALETLGVRPGDEIVIEASATDINDETDAEQRLVRSPARRLRVIAADELVEELRAQLAGVRRAARGLEERQADLERRTREAAGTSPGGSERRDDDRDDLDLEERPRAAEATAAEQRSVTDSAATNAEAVRRIAERIQRNRLDDEAIRDLVEQAARLLDDAGQQSERAEAGLNDLARAARATAAQRRLESFDDESGSLQRGSPTDEEQAAAQQAADAQEEVRDRLGRVAELLQQGQDGWLARRAIERVLDTQRELRRRTAELDRDTVGRGEGDLSEDERVRLGDIAERQARAAEEAAAAIEALQRAAEETRSSNTAQSDAMQRAAQVARQAGVPQQLERAAEQLQQNQTGNAQDAQQAAEEALEDALQEIDEAQQRRDEVLRRVLAELAQLLVSLIAAQEEAIAALDAATERDLGAAAAEAPALADNMIALLGRTLDAADREAAGLEELAVVRDLVLLAAESQERAIVSLRGSPASLVEARTHELERLRHLREALDEAQREEDRAEQRERERRREALAEAYADAATRQAEIRDTTEGLVGQQLDRQTRRDARTASDRQRSLREDVAALVDEYEELTGAVAFRIAHERVDDLMTRAEGAFGRSAVDASALLLQGAAESLLHSLAGALSEQDTPLEGDGFDGGGSSGGGGEQGGEQEQALIELRQELVAVRLMQTQIAELTKALVGHAGEKGGTVVDGLDASALAEYQADVAESLADLLERAAEMQGGGPPAITPEADAEPGNADAAGKEPIDEPTDEQPAVEVPLEPATAPISVGSPLTPIGITVVRTMSLASITTPRLPSLDELLGLVSPDDETDRASDATSDDAETPEELVARLAREKLDEQLSGESATDTLEQVHDLMQDAVQRLAAGDDGGGLATQRLHSEILTKLTQALDSLNDQQQQQNQQQQQQQQQQSGQQQQQSSSAGQQSGGENSGTGEEEGTPSELGGVQLAPELAGAAGSWGRLPERLRGALLQGVGERYSDAYRRQTTRYYVKLAERAAAQEETE